MIVRDDSLGLCIIRSNESLFITGSLDLLHVPVYMCMAFSRGRRQNSYVAVNSSHLHTRKYSYVQFFIATKMKPATNSTRAAEEAKSVSLWDWLMS